MRTLSNIRTLMARELYGYFCSPIAYIFIVVFLVLMAGFTFGDGLGSFYERGVADLERPFFTWHPWLFLVLVPAVGMRLWSEELNRGTIELLCTLPLNLWQAVVAKFLAGLLFLGLALSLTFPVVLTANYLGAPDNGKIAAGYVGSLAMAGAFLALSSFTSSLTRNQIVSFIIAVVLNLGLVLAGYPTITNALLQWQVPAPLVNFVSDLSVYAHYTGLQRGVLDTRDLAYFVLLMVFGLSSTLVALKNR